MEYEKIARVAVAIIIFLSLLFGWAYFVSEIIGDNPLSYWFFMPTLLTWIIALCASVAWLVHCVIIYSKGA